MEKLLAIYDAIPPRVWVEMTPNPIRPSQLLEQSMGTVIIIHLLSFGVVNFSSSEF